MKELEEEGLNLGAKPKENGVKILKNYIKKQLEKEEMNLLGNSK